MLNNIVSYRQFPIAAGAYAPVRTDASRYPSVQWLGLAGVAAMICLSLTAPVITIGSTLPWVKAEQLLLPVILVIYGWLALTGLARPVRFNAMFLVGSAQCACILLSLIYGAAILHHSLLWRDFLEIPKAWLPVAYFTAAYEAELSERSLRKLLGYFSVAVFLICLYAWAQWIGLGFTYALNAMYSNGLHDDALYGARRVYATFGNANLLGQVMTWTIAAFTLAVMGRVGNRLWYGALALGSVVTMAMTGSRYGLIDAVLVVLLLLALPSGTVSARMKRLGVLVALVPMFAITIWIVASTNGHTFERYQELASNPYRTRSLQQRLETAWPDAEEAIVQSPFFGHGPAKLVFLWTITDSEYLNILKEFGIVGFFSYLMYFLWPLALLWKGLRVVARAGPKLEQNFPANVLVLRLAFIIVITGLAMNFGMSTYFNMVLQGFFWLWLGLGARAARAVAQAAPAALVSSRS